MVIVGGGFAGSKVAKKLQAAFDVTLVDSKDHFVCLISLPSCVCDTAHLSKVTSRHSTVCTLRAHPNSATTLRALWVADDSLFVVSSLQGGGGRGDRLEKARERGGAEEGRPPALRLPGSLYRVPLPLAGHQ